MGAERIEVKRIPCPCGKGRITVTFCSPDHSYAHDGQGVPQVAVRFLSSFPPTIYDYCSKETDLQTTSPEKSCGNSE